MATKKTRAFRRPRHRAVVEALALLDSTYLESVSCYFGSGTRIVLELDEYRESCDLDFLCADAGGYRMLRNDITEGSLGPLAASPITLAREVRADRYGIRTFLLMGEERIKFEIISEGRIALSNTDVAQISVPCLDATSCFAEKFLVNADRWRDDAVFSRDLIDLAFMMANWSSADARTGFAIAAEAYGEVVEKCLDRAIARFSADATYANHCLKRLVVSDEPRMRKGLARLKAKRWRGGT
jgi:Nucleotidyl transferase AbiEii toxin, Type IV TA system